MVVAYQIASFEYFAEGAESQMESKEIHYYFQIFFIAKLEKTLFTSDPNY